MVSLNFLGLLALILVDMGFMSRFQASLEVLILLALATFLAGVYTEPTFIVVGIALGFMVLGVAFVNRYFYILLLPAIALAIFFIFWMARRKKSQDQDISK